MSTCSDGVRSVNEQGVDCGGTCPQPCVAAAILTPGSPKLMLLTGIVAAAAIAITASVYLLWFLYHKKKKRNSNKVVPLKSEVTATKLGVHTASVSTEAVSELIDSGGSSEPRPAELPPAPPPTPESAHAFKPIGVHFSSASRLVDVVYVVPFLDTQAP
jgi:hypothetical protein